MQHNSEQALIIVGLKLEHPVVTAGQTGTYVATRARNVRYNDKINEDFLTDQSTHRSIIIGVYSYDDYTFFTILHSNWSLILTFRIHGLFQNEHL